jgi:hypothetical protein
MKIKTLKMGKVPTLECFAYRLSFLHSQEFLPALNGFDTYEHFGSAALPAR